MEKFIPMNMVISSNPLYVCMHDGDDDALAKDLGLQVFAIEWLLHLEFSKNQPILHDHSAILGCNHECTPFYHFAQHIFLG